MENGESIDYYDQNGMKESIDWEPQSVLNDSVSTESVSDIAEDKDEEAVPQDLSIVSHNGNMNYI